MKKETFFSVLLYTLLICFVILIIIKAYSNITYPFPLEFREGHIYSTTSLMLKGSNPYTLQFYPYYYNSYGILYNLVVLPFAFILGNSLVLHRSINMFFLILSVVIVYNSTNRKNKNYFFKILLSLLYITLLMRESITASPNNMGMCFFLLSVIIPVKCDFNKKSILYSAIFSLLAFYTKPYFLLGWIIITIYMLLFIDYKKTIIYNSYYILVFIFCGYVVSKLLPLYFYETIFAYTDSYVSLIYSIDLIKAYLVYTLPLTVFLSLVYLLIIFDHDKKFSHSFKDNHYLYLSVIITPVLIFVLGINEGAYLSYHIQLLLPLAILMTINCKNRLVDYLATNSHVLLLLTVLLAVPMFMTRPFSPKFTDRNDWNSISQYLHNKNNVLNGAIVAPILIDDNKKIYDNGVSTFVFGFKKMYLTDLLFGLDDELEQRKNLYIANIEEQIKNKKFDAIVLTSDMGSDLNWWYNKVDKLKYEKKQLYYLKTLANNTSWYIEVFEPK